MSSVENLCDSGIMGLGQCGTVGRVILERMCRGCCWEGYGVRGCGS